MKESWNAQQAAWPNSSQRFRGAIRMAVSRGHTWFLTPDEYEPLAQSPCSLCGAPTGNGIGLDRLDHRRGYVPGNVRPCCGPCNLKRGRKALAGDPVEAPNRQKRPQRVGNHPK